MERTDIVAILEEHALLLEMAGENAFKVRAYANGARALEAYDGPWPPADGLLKNVKGIGAGLQADIKALLVDGALASHEALKAKVPAGLLEMTNIPGLGPKKVKAVHDGLGISTVGELEYACLENRLVDLPGFGEKTQSKILESIERWKRNRGKRLYADVWRAADEILLRVRDIAGVSRAEIAGALRRKCEIVEDIALVAATSEAEQCLREFSKMHTGGDAPQRHDNCAVINTGLGLPVILFVTSESTYGTELLKRTGSDAFVASLSPLVDAAEESMLTLVPPELREGPATSQPVSILVSDADIQGIFHVHTQYSDGEASVREMAMRAQQLGYRYIGISDHSETAFYARGLSREAIARQRQEIAALNEELDGITVFSGIEADILSDGALDYDEETLRQFDFVIGSVHSRFNQDRATMTNRLVTALANPYLTILGHMSGRLLLSRDPYDFDLDTVLDAAARHGKVIELNANPHRLDMDWRNLSLANARNIPISINPDAHSLAGLEHTRYGVAMARKGGLTSQQVFNTRSLDSMRAYFHRTHVGG